MNLVLAFAGSAFIFLFFLMFMSFSILTLMIEKKPKFFIQLLLLPIIYLVSKLFTSISLGDFYFRIDKMDKAFLISSCITIFLYNVFLVMKWLCKPSWKDEKIKES